MKRIIKIAKRIVRKIKKHDPLAILREDTYSNEETDEMTGRMIRNQYLKNN